MANFREVNKAVKAAYPDLKIEVVRGEGYVYFAGDDGFDKIESIPTHPVSTSTETLIRMCLEVIEYSRRSLKPSGVTKAIIEATTLKDTVKEAKKYFNSYRSNIFDAAVAELKGNFDTLTPRKQKHLVKLAKYHARTK